jgi:hypothetical protein
MALVERIMGVEEGVASIPVHFFFAANHQRIVGKCSRNDIISWFTLRPEDIAEYDAIAALAPTGQTTAAIANKAMFIEEQHAIFLLAEGRFSGYETPALVRTKIGI